MKLYNHTNVLADVPFLKARLVSIAINIGKRHIFWMSTITKFDRHYERGLAELISGQTHHGGEKAGNSYGKCFAKSLLSKILNGKRYQTRLVVLDLKKKFKYRRAAGLRK